MTTRCSECNQAQNSWEHSDKNEWGHFFNEGAPLVTPGLRVEAPAVAQDCMTLTVKFLPDGLYEASVAEAPGRSVKGKTIHSLLQRIAEVIHAAEENRVISVYDDDHQNIFDAFRGFVTKKRDGHMALTKPSRGKIDYKFWVRSYEGQDTLRYIARRDMELHEMAVERLAIDADPDPVLKMLVLPDEHMRTYLPQIETKLAEKLAIRKRDPKMAKLYVVPENAVIPKEKGVALYAEEEA
jgi:hypothetical protein